MEALGVGYSHPARAHGAKGVAILTGYEKKAASKATKSFRSEVAAFKRRRILEEACRLFYERGYAGTTLDDIAAALNATKPLIYAHFNNKGELLYEICIAATLQSLEAVEVACAEGGTSSQKLLRMVRGMVKVVVRNQANLAVQIREEKQLPPAEAREISTKQKTLDERIRRVLNEGIASGEFKIEDPGLAALCIGGMITWIFYWYRDHGRLSEDEIARGVSRMARMIAGGKV